MNYYALFYYLADDYLARRGEFRSEHLQTARDAHGRGDIVLAGAFADPADRALLVFRTTDRTIVENFAKNDPYVINGLVLRWEIRPWTVVIGNAP